MCIIHDGIAANVYLTNAPYPFSKRGPSMRKADYSGKVNEQYTIDPKKITPSVTLSAKSFVFSGADQRPTVTAVKDGKVALTSSEYSVDFPPNCVDVGAYTITVNLKDNYTGSAAVKFKINPVGTSLKTPARGHKLIKVQHHRLSDHAGHEQVLHKRQENRKC